MNARKIHQPEKSVEAMEQYNRKVDRDTTNLVELSRIAIRGVFSSQVTSEEAVCVSEDLAWFLQEKVNPDFKPDLPAVVASIKQQPFNENAYAVRLAEDEPKVDKDTDLLVELSARVIRLVHRQDISPNEAEDATEDIFCFVRDQLDDMFTPDVDRATANIGSSMKNKATILGDVGLLDSVEQASRNGSQDDHKKTDLVQVGNRLVSRYTVFPN